MSQQEKPALRDIGGIVTLNSIVNLAPVVRRSDNAIDKKNLYLVDEEKLDVKLCHFMQYDFQVYY